jgi:predicted transcriptional regulator
MQYNLPDIPVKGWRKMARSELVNGQWTFLTNHSHTLICLARKPDAVLREVAAEVGITERAVHNIISNLEKSGVLKRSREGRRNHYVINMDTPLRHPLEAHCTLRELVALVEKTPARRVARGAQRSG